MTESHLPLRCNCGHCWVEKLAMPMTVNEWCRIINAIECPKCHTKIDITLYREVEPAL